MSTVSLKQLSNLIALELKTRYGLDSGENTLSKIEEHIKQDPSHNVFDKYVNLVKDKKHNNTWQDIIERVTIHETYFQRDKNILNSISSSIADILQKKEKIRIWSAACSTGEEAYDIGFLVIERMYQKLYGSTSINERLMENLPFENIYIYGTDISEICLKKAKLALYNDLPMGPLRKLDPIKKKHYFIQKEQNTFEIKPFVKRIVKFVVANILSESNQGNFDIIVCRNMMIYFSQENKKLCQERLSGYLNPGGFLFLGSVDPFLLDPKDFNQFSDGSSIWYQKK
jgi:chemotaxis protein methyltransferase CheR